MPKIIKNEWDRKINCSLSLKTKDVLTLRSKQWNPSLIFDLGLQTAFFFDNLGEPITANIAVDKIEKLTKKIQELNKN